MSSVPEREYPIDLAIAVMLADLLGKGFTHVTAEYDGSGDSGQIEWINAVKELGDHPWENKGQVDLTDDSVLADFIWQIVYDSHPGFENEDGGHGTLTIDLATKSLKVEHYNRIVEEVPEPDIDALLVSSARERAKL